MQLKCGARRCHATIIWPHNIITSSQELSATNPLVKKLNLSSEKKNLDGTCPSASYDKKTLA